MNNDPLFRLAVESDVDALIPLMREYYAFDGHSFDDEKTPQALLALLRQSSLGRAWLILDGEAPVGYIVVCFGYSLEWLGRDAFVDELYLREEFRGHGWGRQAMAFVEGEARAEGVRALHLGVTKGNETALQLYRKVGFRKHDSTFLSKWIAKDFSKRQGRHGY
ncbi:MAG TPA: GNAT family N-acetyltransferase [Candidatus Sulfotelmatobacter sp.]|jgi:ribosomal protein S18 acetylase RimI-like enzyme|nr:GNAT family N-acetyltransferase [Candidatus Sulfotelmatobacter sp.]